LPFRYDFTFLKTRDDLVTALGLNDQFFNLVLDFQPPLDSPPPAPRATVLGVECEVVSIPAFLRHEIPKRNRSRGFRIAWEPSFLKNEYKALAVWLAGFFEYKLASFPHPAAFGYVGGRNIKGNAAAHSGHRELIALDLADFFPGITAAKIEALFVGCGMAAEVAELLSRFVTINRALPLGLPTSPVLSNAVFLPTDVALFDLAAQTGATYTRYSDDLSFSGDGPLPSIETITQTLADHGFTVAKAKTRRSKQGQAHFVTGLSISDSTQPHVPRKKKHRLRQELYYAQKHGLGDHLLRQGVNDAHVAQREINRLDGLVKFVAYHEPNLSARIKPQWAAILREAGDRPSYTPRHQDRSAFSISLDEAEFQGPKGPVLALGLSVTQHQGQIHRATRDVLDDALADPFAAGDRDAAVRRGLHFADVTEDVRLRYVERLQALPFEGYVAFARLPAPSLYEATYLRLLGAIVKRRLMAAESQLAHFVIEKNGKVGETAVREVISGSLADLKAENNRRPQSLAVQFVDKPSLYISTPDFLLGVLGKYLRSQDAGPGLPMPRNQLMFERLRGKFRLILDVDTWTEYSRRRPIEPWPQLKAEG